MHQQNPELSERIEKFAIFRAEFEKICLNRVRLFTSSYNDEVERPVPVFLNPMANPVSPQTLHTWAKLQPQSAKFNSTMQPQSKAQNSSKHFITL